VHVALDAEQLAQLLEHAVSTQRCCAVCVVVEWCQLSLDSCTKIPC